MPYNGYRITVEKLTPNGHTMRQAEIVCTSDYTLIDDISEWVKVEIDPDASITKTDHDPTNIPELHTNPWGAFLDSTGHLSSVIDTEKCPVTKSAHIPVTELGVTTCEECAYILTSVWRTP